MIKAGIVGGTGYTGVELLRLLAQHPQVELAAITSRQEAGKAVSALFPSLRGRVSLAFSHPEQAALKTLERISAMARCKGAEEMWIGPPNGASISTIR